MNFFQLTYFRKVAELKSIGQAARELFVTQPAVSKQIRALEDELGERLLDRIGKRVHLTKAGEVLYRHAGKILLSVQEARTAVRDTTATCSGELVIGSSDHIGLHRLPPLLKTFMAACPAVDIRIRCHRSETIIEMVRKNVVDLGLVTVPHPAPDLVIESIWKDPLSLVLPQGHALEQLHPLRLRDTVRFGIILPEKGSMTRDIIDAVYARKRLIPSVAMELAYIETIKVLVRVGLGISILPNTAVGQETAAGTLTMVPLADADFSRNLGAVYLRGKSLSRPAREFLKILRAETAAP